MKAEYRTLENLGKQILVARLEDIGDTDITSDWNADTGAPVNELGMPPPEGALRRPGARRLAAEALLLDPSLPSPSGPPPPATATPAPRPWGFSS